jgi:inositol-hexakisphosphate/diphosphoinositol-pentakisphosphate 1-kinase
VQQKDANMLGCGFVRPFFFLLTDKAAEILATICMHASHAPDRPLPAAQESPSQETSNWVLKANVTVFRHADRTPKQKLKFNFPIGDEWTQPFVALLGGETDEIILREKTQLEHIALAIEQSKALGADGENLTKLTQLSNALFSKIEFPGTKAQLKPVYSKKQAGQMRVLTKLTLVFKWGGEVRVAPVLVVWATGLTPLQLCSSRTQRGTSPGIWVRTSGRI